MAFTSSDLDALNAAIASGHRVVHVEGRRVEYATTDELIKARNLVASEVNAAAASAGGTARRGVFRFRNVTTRGD